MVKQTLYFGNPARLNVENDQLRIVRCSNDSDKSEYVITRPLEDIGIVVIDSPQVIVTAPVLEGLMRYGAAVLVCDGRHLPSGLMLNVDGHSLQAERFRKQAEASLPLKKQLWQQTVIGKIRNQAAVLESRTGAIHGNMRVWTTKVRSGDADNLEARAAVYYWQEILKGFDGVRRARDGDEPNSMLNYGYAIVRAIIARALVGSGLHPTLGIHHRNKYNAYCLADDIMEPYRPYVDRLVMELCDEFGEKASLDNKEVKRRLLSLPVSEVVIGGLRRPMTVAATDTAASLYKCFAGETRKIKYPEIPLCFQT